jgi:hypothetical protein
MTKTHTVMEITPKLFDEWTSQFFSEFAAIAKCQFSWFFSVNCSTCIVSPQRLPRDRIKCAGGHALSFRATLYMQSCALTVALVLLPTMLSPG